jgi:hypothetical protein
MTPTYSDFSRPGIRAVKAEHRVWRSEKKMWLAVLGMVVIGTVILFSGLQTMI